MTFVATNITAHGTMWVLVRKHSSVHVVHDNCDGDGRIFISAKFNGAFSVRHGHQQISSPAPILLGLSSNGERLQSKFY